MNTQKTKPEKSTPVRISVNNKERLAKVARRMADQENRTVTELEIVDTILATSLPRLERKLGIA